MKRYVIGVDIGGTCTKVALLDLGGRILYKADFSTKSCKAGDLLDAVASKVLDVLKEKGIQKKDVLGLGAGLPGLVDFKKGLVFCLTNIPHWKNVQLKGILERKLRLPVFVDNDVKVMAAAEMKYGAGKGHKNAVCITLGTGVGGAIIIDGALYRGSKLVAGEIGHVPLNEFGPRCNCGSSGCLEAYVGREYFLNKARKKLEDAPESIAMKLAGGNLFSLTPELLQKAAKKGDKIAREAWSEMGIHIGNALAGIINLLNPEVIIIGGGMAEAGDVLFDSIRPAAKKKSMKIQRDAVKIVKAKLGNEAGVIGAGEIVKTGVGGRW